MKFATVTKGHGVGMLREEIVNGVKRLHATLVIADIDGTLKRLMDNIRGKAPSEDTTYIFEAFQKYQHEANRFTDIERKIAEIFEIDELGKPSWWSSTLITNKEPAFHSVFEMRRRVQFASEFLPKIIKLVEKEDLCGVIAPKEKSNTHDQLDIFSVYLVEEKNQFSSPQRIVKIISSIEDLYIACAKLCNEKENSISVIACDSGSDKSFDFLGGS